MRIQLWVQYTDFSQATYTDSGEDFCAATGQTWRTDIDYAPVSSPDVLSMQVRLQSAPSINGPWVTEGSSPLYFHP